MKIIYPGVEKEVSSPSFMIGNNLGSYLFLSDKPQSRYQGLFFMENFRMFKTIENIELNEPIDSINLNFNLVERKRGEFIERLFFPKNFNSLIYQLTKEKEIEIILDCKESYDNDDFGRCYEIEKIKGKILVKYFKKSSQGTQYEVYIAIKPDKLNYNLVDKWIKRDYEFDKRRASSPFERYVYSALKIKAQNIVFSMSLNEEDALREADYIFKNITKLKNKNSIKLKNKLKNKEINLAYNCALKSLKNLTFSNHIKGIFAGFPWFFQFWTRDELISSKALYLNGEKEFVKKVLLGQLNGITPDGRMFDKYPASGLKNADSPGWLFKRLSEIKLSEKEAKLVKEKLEFCLNAILKNYCENNLIENKPLETWMDTDFAGDSRAGFRIEIQAMQLFMYKYMYGLSGDIKYKKMELQLKNLVKTNFWNNNYLKDGLNDATIRPNIFIVYYFYPELLSREEWIKCFKTIIPKLWLEWGGFATIEKNSPLFTEEHTGEDNRSYHRGDSWFWLNNLAAIVLNKVSKKDFNDYIKKVLEASTEEILYKGAIGCAAELSSAKELRSEGCLNQAWSNALYIELVEELF